MITVKTMGIGDQIRSAVKQPPPLSSSFIEHISFSCISSKVEAKETMDTINKILNDKKEKPLSKHLAMELAFQIARFDDENSLPSAVSCGLIKTLATMSKLTKETKIEKMKGSFYSSSSTTNVNAIRECNTQAARTLSQLAEAYSEPKDDSQAQLKKAWDECVQSGVPKPAPIKIRQSPPSRNAADNNSSSKSKSKVSPSPPPNRETDSAARISHMDNITDADGNVSPEILAMIAAMEAADAANNSGVSSPPAAAPPSKPYSPPPPPPPPPPAATAPDVEFDADGNVSPSTLAMIAAAEGNPIAAAAAIGSPTSLAVQEQPSSKNKKKDNNSDALSNPGGSFVPAGFGSNTDVAAGFMNTSPVAATSTKKSKKDTLSKAASQSTSDPFGQLPSDGNWAGVTGFDQIGSDSNAFRVNDNVNDGFGGAFMSTNDPFGFPSSAMPGGGLNDNNMNVLSTNNNAAVGLSDPFGMISSNLHDGPVIPGSLSNPFGGVGPAALQSSLNPPSNNNNVHIAFQQTNVLADSSDSFQAGALGANELQRIKQMNANDLLKDQQKQLSQLDDDNAGSTAAAILIKQQQELIRQQERELQLATGIVDDPNDIVDLSRFPNDIHTSSIVNLTSSKQHAEGGSHVMNFNDGSPNLMENNNFNLQHTDQLQQQQQFQNFDNNGMMMVMPSMSKQQSNLRQQQQQQIGGSHYDNMNNTHAMSNDDPYNPKQPNINSNYYGNIINLSQHDNAFLSNHQQQQLDYQKTLESNNNKDINFGPSLPIVRKSRPTSNDVNYIEQSMRNKIHAEMDADRKAIELEMDHFRSQINELHSTLKSKDIELKKTQELLIQRDNEIKKFERLLSDKDEMSHHAKEMWMRESSRASALCERLEQGEMKHAELQRHLHETTGAYQQVLNELKQLKHLFNQHDPSGSKIVTANHPGGVVVASIHSTPFSSHGPNDQMNNNLALTDNIPSLNGRNVNSNALIKMNNHGIIDSELVQLAATGGNKLKNHYGALMPAVSESISSFPDSHNSAAHGSISNLERFRSLLHKPSGTLYEDETLHVAIKSGFKGFEGRLEVWVGNKTRGQLQNVKIEYSLPKEVNQSALSISVVSEPISLLQPRENPSHRLLLQCNKAFPQTPYMSISYLMPDNTPRRIILRLPVGVHKFMCGLPSLPAAQFHSLWRQQQMHLSEVSSIIPLAPNLRHSPLMNVALVAQLGGALTLLPGVEAHPDIMCFAGAFPGSYGMEGNVCLVKIENFSHVESRGNHAGDMSGMVRLVIRCAASVATGGGPAVIDVAGGVLSMLTLQLAAVAGARELGVIEKSV